MDFVIVLEEYADESGRNAFVDRINNCVDFDWDILDQDFPNVEYFDGKDPNNEYIVVDLGNNEYLAIRRDRYGAEAG